MQHLSLKHMPIILHGVCKISTRNACVTPKKHPSIRRYFYKYKWCATSVSKELHYRHLTWFRRWGVCELTSRGANNNKQGFVRNVLGTMSVSRPTPHRWVEMEIDHRPRKWDAPPAGSSKVEEADGGGRESRWRWRCFHRHQVLTWQCPFCFRMLLSRSHLYAKICPTKATQYAIFAKNERYVYPVSNIHVGPTTATQTP